MISARIAGTTFKVIASTRERRVTTTQVVAIVIYINSTIAWLLSTGMPMGIPVTK